MKRWLSGWGLIFLLVACSKNEQPDARRETVAPETTSRSYLTAVATVEAIADPVKRCEAFPDLPGNAWPAGSAKARCRLIRAATPTRAEIDTLLNQRNGANMLEALYQQRLDAHYNDPTQPEALFLAYYAFDESEDAHRLADIWLAKSPHSAFANLAVGKQRISEAAKARGDKWISETSDSKVASMQRLLDEALPMLKNALVSNPRLSPACAGLIALGKMSGDNALRDYGISECLKVDPLSWNVMTARLSAAEPKWGGSLDALGNVVEEIRQRVPKNPALASLLARRIGYEPLQLTGNDLWQQAAPGLDEAARIAPDATFIGWAGIAARKLENENKALIYLSQAIRFAPDAEYFLAERAGTRNALGDHSGARRDAQRAIALDNKYAFAYSTLGEAEFELGHIDESRNAFQIAMQDPEQHQWSLQKWCETYVDPSVVEKEALACTATLVKEFPDDPRALFLRAWVLHKIGDPAAAAVAKHFYARVDPKSARQRGWVDALRGEMGDH